jgi:FAD/FMN-containing dehydrogenase
MMDGEVVRLVEDSIYAAGYPRDAAAVLLVELDGRPEAVAAEERVVTELLRRHGATEFRVASTPAVRARLWQGRKKAFGAMGRMTRDLIVQDAVVPRSKLPEILDRIAAIAAHHQVTVVNVFHAGDGNLHPNICYDRSDADLVGGSATSAARSWRPAWPRAAASPVSTAWAPTRCSTCR